MYFCLELINQRITDQQNKIEERIEIDKLPREMRYSSKEQQVKSINRGIYPTESEDSQNRVHEEDSEGTQRPRSRLGFRPVRLGEMPHTYRGHQQFHEVRHNAACVHHDHRLPAKVVSRDNVQSPERG